jgi:hypothetical protein
MSGITGTQAELLYAMPATVTKNTYTTQAALSGVLGTNTVCKLPGGWLLDNNPNPIGRGLMLECWGTIATTSAATFALALGLDPTAGTIANSIVANTAYTPTAAVTAPWHFQAYYTCSAFATSTATFQVNGSIRYQSVATGGAPTTTAQEAGFSGTQAGFDPRIDNYIELFGTWSASAAGNTTSLQQMFLWGLN